MSSNGPGAFGPLLQARRHAAGLSQEELAERAGVSARTISDLERGVSRPRLRTAASLAEALELTGPGRDELTRAAQPADGTDTRTGGATEADAGPGLDTPSPGSGPDGQATVVPRHLPAPATDFTGRSAELDTLTGLLESRHHDGGDQPIATVVVSAIGGTAGVGKTALAVHWAHQIAPRFPDGQLYINLRGYDPGQPMPPADALATFLRALGVPGPDIPADTSERAARYRSLLAGRRILVLLDNASSVEQVRPLLPGTATCAVVVTSRDTLAGLVARDGARRLDLDLLSPADATILLTTLIGDRAAADPATTTALATACARLPLALRVAAELASGQTGVPLAGLVAELADEQRRLDLLEAGGDPYTAVRAVFSWSYRHLDDDAARTFRRLGLHPGPDFEAYAVAALTGGPLEQARRQLALLARTHLIQPTRAGRYGLHDLLRAYAAELAASEDVPDESRAALTRLFDHYLHAAAAAMDRLFPADKRRPEVQVTPGPIPPVATDAEARASLDAQLATLVAMTGPAAGSGLTDHVLRLSRTLSSYLTYGAHYAEAVIIHDRAATVARRLGDVAAEAEAVWELSVADLHRGRFEQAAGHLRRARALWRQIGDKSGEARTLSNLGIIELQGAHFSQANGYFQQSMALHRELGDRKQVADVMGNVSLAEMRQGRYRDAAVHLREALALTEEASEQGVCGYMLTQLGITELFQGRYPEATVLFEQALGLFREVGQPHGEAYTLTYIGAAGSRQGRHAEAVGHLQHALSLCRQSGERVSELDAINVLGDVYLAADQLCEAQAQYAAGLTLATELGERCEQARALDGLGRVCAAVGEDAEARPHWEQALALYADMGVPEADEVRTRLESC